MTVSWEGFVEGVFSFLAYMRNFPDNHPVLFWIIALLAIAGIVWLVLFLSNVSTFAASAPGAPKAASMSPALMNQRWVFIGSDSCPACRQQKQEMSSDEVSTLYMPIDPQNPFFFVGLQYQGKPAIEAIPAWVKFPAGWSVPRIRALQQSWKDVPANLSEQEHRLVMQEMVVNLEDVRIGMQPRAEVQKLLSAE